MRKESEKRNNHILLYLPRFHEGEAEHGVEEGVHEVGQAEVHDEGVGGVPHASVS